MQEVWRVNVMRGGSELCKEEGVNYSKFVRNERFTYVLILKNNDRNMFNLS